MADDDGKKRFIVRQSKEYSLEVRAKDEKEAIDIAREVHIDDPRWDSAWANLEAEEA